MMITYTCNSFGDSKPWDGQIEVIQLTAPYEVEVTARGSNFHLIFGRHAYGLFLCIPNWSIGTELGGLHDRFWNQERLMRYTGLGEVDACSVADALYELRKYIEL